VGTKDGSLGRMQAEDEGRKMKAGLDFWLYVSNLGSVPPLRMSRGGVARLVCTMWGKISNLLEGSKRRAQTGEVLVPLLPAEAAAQRDSGRIDRLDHTELGRNTSIRMVKIFLGHHVPAFVCPDPVGSCHRHLR
jgi:hypothetical protein